MVVNFWLGRRKNIAPVHKSKLRKRADFYFVPGRSWGAFWRAFGTPFGSLWDTLGDLGVTLGDLGVTWEPLWPARGCSGTPLGFFFARLGRLFHSFCAKV